MLIVEPEEGPQEDLVPTLGNRTIRERVGINSVCSKRRKACVLKVFLLFTLRERTLIENDRGKLMSGVLLLDCSD